MKRGSSLTAWLDRIAPPLARVLARDRKSRGQPLSLATIAKAGGLPFNRARRIAAQKSWADVTVADAEAFLNGCGITLDRWSQECQYLRRTGKSQIPLVHLEKLRAQEKTNVLKNLRKTKR